MTQETTPGTSSGSAASPGQDTAHGRREGPVSGSSWNRAAVQEFFAERASRWDSRFPDDGPAYAAAVAQLGLRPGERVLDAGCGTGRAFAPLREAVGPNGTVLGLDVTPAMLEEATRAGRHRHAALLLGDVAQLPLPDACLDAVFGAGLVSHMPGPGQSLRELARVVRPSGRLALFHPMGRRALAARHGHALTPDDVRAEPRLRPLLTAAGWRMLSYVDEDDRYLVLARRE
ncbi:class I SAM-dependent methyltransferase [Streptomyces cacaoi]|uniref:class I SAM-dependent methyltransferase n=1 Tax=Streptomyces cacaoi TaxID=1898 RepID=UPI0011F11858|nr:methyltransferase domain-containing protein [Streptomyces cacaoi]